MQVTSPLCSPHFVLRTRWPWRETACVGQVLIALARLHRHQPVPAASAAWFAEWDYERELIERTRLLIQIAEENVSDPATKLLRRSLSPLRRIVSALPDMRRELLQFQGWGSAFIHGDVHSGNVILKKTASGPKPVLLDWGRARMGSPLEDVSSWLQSLGYWEPEARRRHDTLLGTYLQARGQRARITRETRDAYWLAAASNLLAGAILYHWSTAQNLGATRSGGAKQAAALHALGDCLRVIRRADACWRS